MKVGNIEQVDMAVKRSLEHIDTLTKSPADAYHAAVTVLLKTLTKNELYLGHKEMKLLCTHSLASARWGDDNAVNEIAEIVDRLLGTPATRYHQYPIDVLVKVLSQTLQQNDVCLTPEQCVALGVINNEHPVSKPTDYLDVLIAYLDKNPDVKIPEEQANKLALYIDYKNERTKGTIIDHGNTTERYRITMPVLNDDLSDALMDLAERMGNGGYRVDKRAWDHLLIYAPQYQKLKKKLKRLKRFLKLF